MPFQAPFSRDDPTRLSRRKWYLMSGGWALVLVPWLVLAVTTPHPWPVRVLLALAVVGYGAVYMFGVFEAKGGIARRCRSW
jgi:hypothetical protein